MIKRTAPVDKDTPLVLAVSRATLAAALDISESTVDDFVRRGLLPRPMKISTGCVRWRLEDIKVALASFSDAGHHAGNTVDLGVQRAIQAAKGRGRG